MSKDVNPYSPTYNQYKFEYTDDHPDCSPIPDFQLVEGDTYRDENPGSPFYGEEMEFTNSTPTWLVFKQRCHEETYQPSGAVGQDGSVEEKRCDVNPNSATYQEVTDWEIAVIPDIECSAVDTDPILDFKDRTVITEQNDQGIEVPTGEVINNYLDINKYSSTYGSTTTEAGTDSSLIPDRRVKFDKDYGLQELHYSLPLNVRWAINLYSPLYRRVAVCLSDDNQGVWPDGAVEPGHIRLTTGFSAEVENVGELQEGESLGEGGLFFSVGLVDLESTSNTGRCVVDPDYLGSSYLRVYEYGSNLPDSGVDRSADVVDLQLGYIRHSQPYDSLENFTNLRNLDLTWTDYDGSVQCDVSQNRRLLYITMSVTDPENWSIHQWEDYVNDNFILPGDRGQSYTQINDNTFQLKFV